MGIFHCLVVSGVHSFPDKTGDLDSLEVNTRWFFSRHLDSMTHRFLVCIKKRSRSNPFFLSRKKQQFRFCHGNLKGPTAPNTNSPEPGLKAFQNNQNWLMNATILFPGARMGGRFKLQHWVVVSFFLIIASFWGNDQIWPMFFRWVLQPPTRTDFCWRTSLRKLFESSTLEFVFFVTCQLKMVTLLGTRTRNHIFPPNAKLGPCFFRLKLVPARVFGEFVRSEEGMQKHPYLEDHPRTWIRGWYPWWS